MRSKLAKKHAAKQPTRTDLKTKPWRARGAIAGLRVRMPSRRHVIDSELVLLAAKLLDEVANYCEEHRYVKIVGCPEYEFLARVCYASGFVVGDMKLMDGRTFDSFKNDPLRVSQADFPDIRRFLHILWRAERHSDIGEDIGGGHVIEAAESGVLIVLATRLRQIVEGARKS
jgi:hypothetical protein